MSLLLDCLAHRALTRPERIVADDGEQTVTAAELLSAVRNVRHHMQNFGGSAVALIGDNTLGWMISDLALLGLPLRVVPLPAFFSAAQVAHVIQEAGIDTVLGTPAALAAFPLPLARPGQLLLPAFTIECARIVRHNADPVPPKDTAVAAYEKVTFTSGSTGQAKGVRLSLDVLENTAQAIALRLDHLSIQSHLCVLPFATLLENVAGIYAALLQDVTLYVRRMDQLGLSSPEHFNPFLLAAEIQKVQPQATILVPQLLLALVTLVERGLPAMDSFRFMAVGGGKVASRLIEKAHALGMPVYEGYGLSECGSVVTLNVPGESRIGSVGKPLSHCRIHLAGDGEIMISGAVMGGYMNEPAHSPSDAIATGDLGYFDEDGYLHVSGRKKNMFITAFGRNVNPEWIEAELLRHLPVRQVAVFGEGLPLNVAVIVTRPGYGQTDIEAAVTHCNQSLPDYARIGRIILSPTAFTPDNDMATANGRNRRGEIERQFGADIQNAFSADFSSEENTHVFF